MIKSAYIHIPFCEQICSYCDFCKILYDKKIVQRYLTQLEKEIDFTYKGEELSTIYIGGGTPSSLDCEELEKLLKIIQKLKVGKDLEYTIEANFSSITKEKLELLKKYHINRISLGVESIHPKNLEFLNRFHTKEEIEEKIKWMRELDFKNINLDLMYALPKETIREVEEDVDYILSLGVEHISTYSLMIEKNTVLGIRNIKNISEDIDSQMYQAIINKLKQKGYIHYEISNFAKKGYESKHNKCYWKNEEYYGFGVSASSYQNDKRITNTKSMTKYITGTYSQEIEELTQEDQIEYEILLNLRMLEGINLKDFHQKYQKDLIELYNYQDLINQGLLESDNDRIWIPENKLYVSNEIIVKLLQNKKEL